MKSLSFTVGCLLIALSATTASSDPIRNGVRVITTMNGGGGGVGPTTPSQPSVNGYTRDGKTTSTITGPSGPSSGGSSCCVISAE